MTKKKQNQQPTMEEALASRAEVPEPTHEELTMQALSDQSAQEMVGQFQPPPPQVNPPPKKTQFPIQENKPKQEIAETTSIQPETVTMSDADRFPQEPTIILASSTDPQPATPNSTRGYQEQPPQGQNKLTEKFLNDAIDDWNREEQSPQGVTQDKNLRRLVEYVAGKEFSPNWVRLHLVHICRLPSVIPSISLWEGTTFDEMAKIIYDIIRSPGYIETCWPCLRKVMGSSKDNVEWCCGVLCTMALFDAIKFLPYAGEVK